MGAADGKEALLAGRIIVGIGIGKSSTVVIATTRFVFFFFFYLFLYGDDVVLSPRQ